MKILLLNSPWINTENEYGIKAGTRWAAIRKKDRSMLYFPFPYFLATSTAVLQQAGFNAHIKDAIAEELSYDDCMHFVAQFHPDILVIEAFTPSFSVDIAFAQQARQKTGCITILCGAHVTSLPKETLQHEGIDFVLMGEYDYTLREVVCSLQKGARSLEHIAGLAYKHNGSIMINPRRPPIENVDELPFPARDELPMQKYNEPFSKYYPTAKIVTSRGCPYQCIFCIEPLMYQGPSYKTRSVKLVIEEIQFLMKNHHIREIFFDDALFTIARAKEIARGILDNHIKIAWSCWIDWNIGFEDLRLLKQSGCIGIKFGIESAETDILKTAHKPIQLEKIKKLIQSCKKLGLLRNASFLFGLPKETKESIAHTIDLAFSLDLTSCQLAIATPLPGTPFFHMAEQNGWLLTKDWSQYESLSHAVVAYPGCSAQDIEQAIDIARHKKIQYMLRHPLVACRYLIKLYQLKGAKEFCKDITKKLRFFLRKPCP